MLPLFLFGLLFCVGAVVGSFLAHLVHSIVHEKSAKLWGRSCCDHCNKLLSTVELIPIVGFLVRRGMCPSCKKRINRMYPFIELATAFLFAISSLYFSSSPFVEAPYIPLLFFAFLSIVIYTSATDILLKAFSIRPLIVGTILSLITCVAIGYPTAWQDSLIAIGAGLLFFAVVAGIGFLWKRSMVIGEGDFYLIAFLWSTLGIEKSIIALYIAILSGAIIGALLLAWKKGHIMAFAPFLSLGWFIAYFHGHALVEMYFSLF